MSGQEFHSGRIIWMDDSARNGIISDNETADRLYFEAGDVIVGMPGYGKSVQFIREDSVKLGGAIAKKVICLDDMAKGVKMGSK